MTSPPIEPQRAPRAAAAPRPTCHNTACTERPIAQWRRRLTEQELAVELAIEQGKRDARFLLRDVQKPAPVFGPMPTGTDFVRAVLACGPHAIGLDSAALVHEASCAGPNSATLPACGCTPEPAAPQTTPAEPVYPAHWASAMAGSD
jgi:hypothetical protein